MSNEKRKYVGARYVPLFSDPLVWSNTREYEPLTIVLNEGNSYTSRQFVPLGIDISNESYWALTGNYDAQVEQYRQEVQAFDGRITSNANAISALTSKGSVMIAIGDSFGNEAGEWADLVSKSLGKTLFNGCIGGASWPFADGLQMAVSAYNTPEKKKEISLIVAYGGINAITGANPMTDATAIKNFITACNTAFPGVPLFIAPMNSCSPYNTNFPNIYRNAMLSVPVLYHQLRNFAGNFILLEGSHLFNTGNNALWQADLLHPNALGSATIANNIISSMFGNNSIYQEMQQFGDLGTKIIEMPGFFTDKGVVTPRIVCDTLSPKAVYFYANGFYLAKPTLLEYDIESADGTFVHHYPTTEKDPVIMSDPNNPQMSIKINGVTWPEGGKLVIPSQFIPYTVKDRV